MKIFFHNEVVFIFNKEKQMIKWSKTRKMGKWKFTLLYGVLLGGSICFVFSLISNTFLYTYHVIKSGIIHYLLSAVIFGILSGIGIWFISERKYKRYIDQ
ncbi:hypothetical protein [Litchfieldia alkalitelluris]|uniref:hypothetical protein n=1 Tax=Litchfieldia alkalitelluris TaxID=304268 RepID=UPI00195E7888|nr:hypothetical protein [Litchfieldia alkalitelluris]